MNLSRDSETCSGIRLDVSGGVSLPVAVLHFQASIFLVLSRGHCGRFDASLLRVLGWDCILLWQPPQVAAVPVRYRRNSIELTGVIQG